MRQIASAFTVLVMLVVSAWVINPRAAERPREVQAGVDGGERGRVHIDGLVFRRNDGSIFPWRGASEFLLFDKFRRGVDILPFITRDVHPDQAHPTAPGANIIRVFILLDWSSQRGPQFDGGVGPRIAPDAKYYADLRRFVDYVWARGVRVELSSGDFQLTIPDAAARIAHMQRLGETLRDHPAVFLEMNEPFKNLPGGAAEADRLGRILQGYGLLVSNGNYDIAVGSTDLPHLNYVTNHPDRTDQFPSGPLRNADVRDGFEWKKGTTGTGTFFKGVKVPVVDDEGMGVAEARRAGSRTNNCDDMAYYGAMAALMGAGATFHSDGGVYSTAWGPVQTRCAVEFFSAIAFIPAEAQLAQLEPRAGSPASRFCKIVGGVDYCVEIRPTTEHMQPPAGWVLDTELRKGIARFKRGGASRATRYPRP
jgi:hypothetical protein